MNITRTLSCQALVVGGGSAGLAAAIAAARGGLSVVLVEQYGFCGGMSVTCMVHSMDGLLANHDLSKLAVGGFGLELVERIGAAGGWACEDNPAEAVCFQPEVLKLVADRMVLEAGVRPLYHTKLVDVEKSGDHLTAAIVHGKSGFWRIEAEFFIDGSGDGDLCAWAGAPFETSDVRQPMTQHFKIAGMSGNKTWKQLENDCHMVLQAAYDRGDGPKFGGPWIIRERAGEISLNCTRHYGDTLDPENLTQAEIDGRANAWRVFELWKKELPDFQQAHFEVSGPAVGVRESRRILGDYQITREDLIARTAFPDVIGLGAWPFDIHPANGAVGYHPHKENPPPPYPIPFRCLLPRDLENALVAGRCASATHEAHGSTRVQGTALMMGEAAGAACVEATKAGTSLREISLPALQDRLLKAGAILDCHNLPDKPEGWPRFR